MEEVIDNFGTVSMDSSSPMYVGAKECTNNTAELTAIIEAMIWALERADLDGGVVQGSDLLDQWQGASNSIPALDLPWTVIDAVLEGRWH